MVFLPFVVTFLMILVLGGSLLFTSIQNTALEKKIIFSQKSAHLSLMSSQALAKYNLLKTRAHPIKKPKAKRQTTLLQKAQTNSRHSRGFFHSSKFNLWPLVQDKHSPLSKILYDKAVRLIEILYQKESFYQKFHDPELAKKILDAMLENKGEKSLVSLFPKDPILKKIYYQMMQGTNTKYPSLREFFKIEECSKNAPIQFHYASTPVLMAILGKTLGQEVLRSEKEKQKTQNRGTTLTKQQMQQLLLKNPSSEFPFDHLEKVFSFSLKNKGVPELYVDQNLLITATKTPL